MDARILSLLYIGIGIIWWLGALTLGLPIFLLLIFSQSFRNASFAWLYATVAEPFQRKKVDVVRKKAFQILKDSFSGVSTHPPLEILEIGVGHGPNLKFYPENCNLTVLDKNKYFETDFMKNRNKYPQVFYQRTVIQPAECMKRVDDNSFDVVVSTFLHCSVDDSAAVLREVKRVLKPGCVLSPTLFSLFISGAEKYVNPSQIGLFADDVVLCCRDANISKMESQLNRCLVNIEEFADNHKITFNASKSVSLFTTNRQLHNYSPEIFLMSERLNYSKYPTYLGFTLDSEVHTPYTTLVRPVLEYGYQIFQVASPTNLKKLERVQLSAARIITRLRYSCPTDIFLYEAEIQPLTMRFEVNSYRYFNKIKSFGSFNRTSSFIINSTSNQRLKRDSPLNYRRKHGFIDFNVDTSTPFSCITPIDSFNHVEFQEELLTSTPKHSSHPELLRQLALEVINDIPDHALIVYTDSSRSDTGKAGSGVFSNTPGNDVKSSIRTPDHCSVFRSELIAISGALDHALNSYKDSLVRGNKCLQWIPSHVGVPGNEDADELAGRGCDLPNPSSTVLTHTEIHSFQRNKMNLTWRNPPAHHWYAAKSPGLSIQCRNSRAHQTAFARLRSGHLRSMNFVQR
ncbi:methyltransferase-like protein 7B [Trichonephila clavipes]|nr:methyltransferase-like protein 7B [Trichonephila clavipes]